MEKKGGVNEEERKGEETMAGEEKEDEEERVRWMRGQETEGHK